MSDFLLTLIPLALLAYPCIGGCLWGDPWTWPIAKERILRKPSQPEAAEGGNCCPRCGSPDYETESGIVESCACRSNTALQPGQGTNDGR